MLNKLKRISKLLSRYLLLIFVLTLISVSVFLRNLKMVMIEYAPIKKTDSLFSAIRIVLMDKNYSFDYGFIYPNMISMIGFILFVIVILWIIEDNKITIDLAKKCFCTWFSICIFIGFICAVEHCDVSNLFMIYMYLIRFFSLLFEIIFLRTIFQILYKKEFFVYLQFLFLILMTFLDNYSKTNLVTMSSNSVFEGIYFCIIIVTSVLSYCLIRKFYINQSEDYL